MKSTSDVRPEVIQDLGNGAFYYNYNIVEKEVEEEGETKIIYEYDTVKVWNEPTYEKLVKAVIREELDETQEFALVNSYNAAQLGIIEGSAATKAISDYKSYLSYVEETKEMVRHDMELLSNE